MPRWPVTPEIDEMLTIDPPPALFMIGIANFMPRNVPCALTAISRSQAAVSNRSSTALPLIPASLTRMSSLPNAASGRVDRRLPFGLAGHVELVKDRGAVGLRDLGGDLSCPPRRACRRSTTLAPSRAKIRAMLAPMPDAPPVISATLFSSLMRSPSLSPWPGLPGHPVAGCRVEPARIPFNSPRPRRPSHRRCRHG